MICMARIDDGNRPYYWDKYFFDNPDAPGIWGGTGCDCLGLSGTVAPNDYKKLFEGFAPNGDPLIRNAGPTTGWYGIDMPGNLPKPLSVALFPVLRDHPEIANGLLVDAYRPLITFMEDRVLGVRFGHQGVERERAKAIVTMFPQYENRLGEVNGHVHAIWMRPAYTADGRSGALDQRDFFQPNLKLALGALFRAEASHLCEERFGMKVVRDGFAFKIEHVPDTAVEGMSKRRRGIEEHLQESGYTGAKASAIATLATREPKEHVPLPALVAKWENELAELGFGPKEMAQCYNQPLPEREPLETRKADALRIALERVTEQRSAFSDLELIRYVAEEAQGRNLSAKQVLETVDHALEHSPQVVRLGYHEDRPLFTTRAVLELEKQLIRESLAVKNDQSHVVSEKVIASVLARHEHLSEEQRTAVRYLTEQPGTVQCVTGWPGVGKTTLVQACREAWEAEGFSVVGTTVSGKAAVGLTQEAGIPSETIASTLAGLRPSADSHRPARPIHIGNKHVVVIDEAATVGTPQLSMLTHELLDRGAKVVMIGDPRQTQSVACGGAFLGLSERLGHCELNEIRRQKDEWARQAIKDLGLGNTASALNAYAERGLVTVKPDRRQTMLAMVEDWTKDGAVHPEKHAMLTATRAEAAQVNALAQAARIEKGLLPPLGIRHEENVFHIGDRVLCTRNNRALGVRNGHLGTIVDISNDLSTLVVQIDNSGKAILPLAQYPHVSLGYGMTSHKAQGATFDSVYSLVGETTNRELAVVQASRHREQCRFYVDELTAGPKLKELTKAFHRSEQKHLATDVTTVNRPYVVLRPEFQP